MVRAVQCLQPEVRDQESSQTMMRELCMALPTIDNMEVIKVTDEWKIFRYEIIQNNKIYKKNGLFGLIAIGTMF
ncbi:hypothetical protein DPMN_047789 [Dreissena polymorpha]|uniref:Uncharacterized protein n=1 Tax=Dreissena polymorpha TaxID=45954 RepID=A0A9D4I3E3_DREPO|nr:hypothetical protein DPMN_047789 [Dreissena polymorpha]